MQHATPATPVQGLVGEDPGSGTRTDDIEPEYTGQPGFLSHLAELEDVTILADRTIEALARDLGRTSGSRSVTPFELQTRESREEAAAETLTSGCRVASRTATRRIHRTLVENVSRRACSIRVRGDSKLGA
jgi:hypothetical protein